MNIFLSSLQRGFVNRLQVSGPVGSRMCLKAFE
jgi:hypothetical protein